MKGQVLNVNAQTNGGVISGDDGNRYTFDRTEWRMSDEPRRGLRVDFDPDGSAAREIYAEIGAAGISPPVTTSPAGQASLAALTTGSTIWTSGMGGVGMFVGLAALILFWVPLFGSLLLLVGMGLSLTALVIGKRRSQPVGLAVSGVLVNSVALGVRTLLAVIIGTAVGIAWALMRDMLGPLIPIIDLLRGDIFRFF